MVETLTLIASPWRRFRIVAMITGVWISTSTASWCQESAINLHQIPSDISIPPISDELPNPGKRVRQRNTGYEDWNLYHILYLPINWKPDQTYPIIAEYPGRGGYKNQFGDESLGRPEDCKLGYGATEGKGVIWVSLPFVDPVTKGHSIRWWGDADVTTAYCRQTIDRICSEYGGDRKRVVLAGFSRGAIACSYIGLRDDATARLWCGLIAHSHYDGVRRWGYPDDDPESARTRLARFQGAAQFVSNENNVEATKAFLDGISIKTEFVALPYPNHSDEWVLKDIPERERLRNWLKKLLAAPE
jgi:hypothetical protein